MGTETAGYVGRAVPVRRVFPWWYLGGFVATVGLMALLAPGASAAIGTFWGPAVGLAVKDRESTAQRRKDQGLPLDSASLRGPRWLEPVVTVLLTGAVVGLGLLLAGPFGDRAAVPAWGGAVLLGGSALGSGALLVGLRRARRRRGTR